MYLDGIAQVIDELGYIIISKNIELEIKQKEIDELRIKIEAIESYIDSISNYK